MAFKGFTIAAMALAACALFACSQDQQPTTQETFAPDAPGTLPPDFAESWLGAPPDPKDGGVIEDIWKPAKTPAGGTDWTVLEATEERTRLNADGIIFSKPRFTSQVKAMEGETIKLAGWMSALDASATQSRFLLMGYPPGCPFHFHAAPNQFVEVLASEPFKTDERSVLVVTGVLELTGYDESGIFYRLKDARPG